MHLVGDESPHDAARLMLRRALLTARGADDIILWHIDAHVVAAKVGVELADAVEGEVGPATIRLEARQLGKPLGHHVEALVKPGAQDQAR